MKPKATQIIEWAREIARENCLLRHSCRIAGKAIVSANTGTGETQHPSYYHIISDSKSDTHCRLAARVVEQAVVVVVHDTITAHQIRNRIRTNVSLLQS